MAPPLEAVIDLVCGDLGRGEVTSARKPYPFDVSDGEWALVAPYLTLLPEKAVQHEHSLREVFNGRRDIIKSGAPWR